MEKDIELISMNSFVLHITGGAEIESAVENDTEYQIVGLITTFSVGDERSNQDGSYQIHNKAKFSGPITLIKGEKMIRGKDVKKESQKTRGAILALQNEVERLDVETEVFYAAVQGMIRRNLLQIYETFKNEINLE